MLLVENPGFVSGGSTQWWAATQGMPQGELFMIAEHAPPGSDGALFLRAEREADGSRTFKLREREPLPTSYGQDSYERIFGTNGTPARTASDTEDRGQNTMLGKSADLKRGSVRNPVAPRSRVRHDDPR